jgi:hypothetical protein
MSGPFSETPSQAAGLIGGGSTDDDLRLWTEFKASPQARAILAETAAKRLARRRELIAQREAEEARLQAMVAAHDAIREAAAKRLLKAEAEFRAALEASRSVPLYAPPDSKLLSDIARELRETADPRIGQVQDWLTREAAVTTCYEPPLVIVPREDLNPSVEADRPEPPMSPGMRERYLPGTWRTWGSGAGFDQQVYQALIHRRRAITEAAALVADLAFRALDEGELVSELERTLEMVPSLPDKVRQVKTLPAPLTIDGKNPKPAQTEHESSIAEVGKRYQRAQERIAAASRTRARK